MASDDEDTRVAAGRVDVRRTRPARGDEGLAVMERRVRESRERALELRRAHPGAPAGVDDDLGGGERARPDAVAEEQEPAHGVVHRRERRDRARRDLQKCGGNRGGEQDRSAHEQEPHRTPHDRAGEARPEAVVDVARSAKHFDPAHPAHTEHREECRLQRRGRQHRRERDEEAADAERADERHGDEEQQRETDRNGRAGEEHRAAGRLHRADDRTVDVARGSELLAEPVDDKQRVVDGEPEPDELDEIRDIAHHRDAMRETEDDGERRGDRAGRKHERHEHGEREPEHREEHRERDRQRDRLAAQQVVREHRLEVVLDRRLAGDVRARLPGERASHRRRVALRVLEVERRVDLAVEQPAVGAQPRGPCAGHEPGRLPQPPLRGRQLGAGARGRRP